MQPSPSSPFAGDWATFVLCVFLTVVVLLAPFAPFAGFVFVACCRPAWWAIFWQNPVLNGVLLAFALAFSRVVFLQNLYLLARVLWAAAYPMTLAWIPEMLARRFLSNFGLDVSPTPYESRLRCLTIAFALNLTFWLGLLLPIASVGWLWPRRWRGAKP